MSLKTSIVGGNSVAAIREAGVHRKGVIDGLLTLTEPLFDHITTIAPLVNPTVGADMNQNVSFGTIPSIIHDGGTTSSADTGTADADTLNKLVDSSQNFASTVVVGMVVHNTTDDTYATVTAVDSNTTLSLDSDAFPDGNEDYVINAVWVGTAVQGTWDFAATGKITITNGVSGDEASIDADPAASWDFDNFTALTMKVDFDAYDPIRNDVVIVFDLNGITVGNSVQLNDYADTGNFAEQSIAIPKADFGISGQTVNGLTLLIERSGGTRPDIKFDDIQLEASGTPLTFSYRPNGKQEELIDVEVLFVDNVTEANSKDYNALLGVTLLPIGISVQAISAGNVVFSGLFRRLFDFLQIPGSVTEFISDGTNSVVKVNFNFRDFPVILDPNSVDGIFFTINDDLSTLLELRTFVKTIKHIDLT